MIKEWITEWFTENGNTDGELDFDSNYLDSGVIDSIAFVSLIAECEEQFEIAFEDQDFEGQEMFTINGLIRLIENKKVDRR